VKLEATPSLVREKRSLLRKVRMTVSSSPLGALDYEEEELDCNLLKELSESSSSSSE